MTFLLVISLLFSSSQFDLSDDVVCEYSILYFTHFNTIVNTDSINYFLLDLEMEAETSMISANESSAELNRLYYRCPRDCLIRTHGD